MRRLTPALKRRLVKLRRYEHHPIIHLVAKKHKISRRTLFYMKEYGSKSHIVSLIIKESMFSLILAFIIGTFAGISLESIGDSFFLILPLVILFPAINDMIGDYSMIMVSRMSTLAFTKNLKGGWWEDRSVRKLIKTIFEVAVLSAFYISMLSSAIAYLKGYQLTTPAVFRILQVSLLTTLVMVAIVVVLSSFAVFYIYKRREDPNNFVMPIMTSLADLGTILTFGLFVSLIF
ncbi:MAG: magnesium transporter [Candidatus Aenigmarchaeota archaeon]|nr:magnesium transporter [Candidatus Aenigmarchaeota archaeon]